MIGGKRVSVEHRRRLIKNCVQSTDEALDKAARFYEVRYPYDDHRYYAVLETERRFRARHEITKKEFATEYWGMMFEIEYPGLCAIKEMLSAKA